MSKKKDPTPREELIKKAYDRLAEFDAEDEEALQIAKFIKQMEDNKPCDRADWLPTPDTLWKIGASATIVVAVVVLETTGHSIMTKGLGFIKQLGLL